MPTPDPPFDRLYADIKLSIPGAIDTVIYHALWSTIDDFLVETNVWVEEIPVSVQPNVYQYTITPAGKGGIIRLLMVYDPANAAPDKRWTQQSIQFQPPDQIIVPYSPSTLTTWMAAVSKRIIDPPLSATLPMPTTDNNIVWIFDRYRDGLVSGALGKLFMQPSKPYTNPQLAGFHRQQYTSARSRARTDVLHANVYGGQRWLYPQGYATTARKGST